MLRHGMSACSAILLTLSLGQPVKAATWTKESDVVPGKWGVYVLEDAMTDEKMRTALFIGDKYAVVMTCKSGSLAVMLRPYSDEEKLKFLTVDERVDVQWRVDKQPALKESWFVPESGATTVGTPKGEVFTSSLMSSGDRMLIQTHGETEAVTMDNAANVIREALGGPTGCLK